MKNGFYLFLCLLTGFTSIACEPFYDHNVYGGLLYNVLKEWTSAHSITEPDDVHDYLNSKACSLIFSEAIKSGYTRRDVMCRAKWVAVQADPVIEVIVAGLEKEMRNYVLWSNFHWWATAIGTAFSATVSLGALGFALFYFKKDRRVMLRY